MRAVNPSRDEDSSPVGTLSDRLFEGELTRRILAAAAEVHGSLGPGLPEAAYVAALAHEFSIQELAHRRALSIQMTYKGVPVDGRYAIDFVVEGRALILVRCADGIRDLHRSELLLCLKQSRIRLGLILNFRVASLVQGVFRKVV